MSRQRLIERLPGADIRRHRIEDGVNPRRFGIHFGACRSDLGTIARHLVLPKVTFHLQHVGQARDNAFSHSTGRRRQFLPNMFGEQSRVAQIFAAVN